MDFANPLKMINGATEVAKTLLTAETLVEKAQLQVQMAEVLGALASARMALIDADRAVADKDAEIARLHAAREMRGRVVEGRGGYFWLTDPSGNKMGYPCCPSCLVREDRQVPMVRDGALNRGRCPQCHERFSPVTYYNAPAVEGQASAEEFEASAGIMSFGELGEKLA